MALDPRNTAQIRERELRVWDLLLKGIEGLEIARREGVDPAVISRIKKRVRATDYSRDGWQGGEPEGPADRRDSARAARGVARVGGIM